MNERDAVPLDETAQVIVIGDHAGYVHQQLAAAPAVQQVIQAVVLPADQDHHPLSYVESLTCQDISNSFASLPNARAILPSNGSESARISWRMKKRCVSWSV